MGWGCVPHRFCSKNWVSLSVYLYNKGKGKKGERTTMFDNIFLEYEQIDLFCKMVEFMKSIPREKRSKFIVAQTFNGDSLLFPGHSDKNLEVYLGDLEELTRQGLLSESFSSQGAPNFDITGYGYRYYEYLQGEKIKNEAPVNNSKPPDLNIRVSQDINATNGGPERLKPIFISYAHEDKDAVYEIVDNLKKDGYEYFLDKNDILPGDLWKDKIEDAIENAQNVLLFLSNKSISKTGYVQHEVRFALEQSELRPSGKRYVIPILLEPCEPPRDLREYQWLSYWEAGAYEKLKASLS
jgi:hypothetical protein